MWAVDYVVCMWKPHWQVSPVLSLGPGSPERGSLCGVTKASGVRAPETWLIHRGRSCSASGHTAGLGQDDNTKQSTEVSGPHYRDASSNHAGKLCFRGRSSPSQINKP